MKGPLPPYVQLPNFLPDEECDALLHWALANQDRFKPAKVSQRYGDGVRDILKPEARIALRLRDIGTLQPSLEKRLLAILPELISRLQLRGAEPRSLELELAAHGDGAHFHPHTDIPLGPGRIPVGGTSKGEDRVLSAVYYFHSRPKAFAGGELRLHRLGSPSPHDPVADDYVDVEPRHNSLVAFPSWVLHEVRRVRCPSGQFLDFRFALSCWYCARLLA